jgi:hypothetical protein
MKDDNAQNRIGRVSDGEMLVGVVETTKTDKKQQQIAHVRPLVRITGKSYRKVDSEEFPSRGEVIWFNARSATKDALMLFRVQETSEGPIGHPFKYKVTDEPEPAHEVVDLTKFGSPEDVRLALTVGLKGLRHSPGRFLLLCESVGLVGPVKLVSDANGLKFDEPHLDRLACYSAARFDSITVSCRGQQRVVLGSGVVLRAPDGYVDWDDDKAVLRRCITWAVNHVQQTGEERQLTNRVIDKAAEALARAGSASDRSLEHHRLGRARKILENSKLAHELAIFAVETLTKTPALSLELNKLREEARAEGRAQLEADLQTESDALKEAREEYDKLLDEINTSTEQLAELKKRIETEVSDVEAEVAKRVNEVLKKPAALLAEVSLLRAVLHTSSEVTGTASPSGGPPVSRIALEWRKNTQEIHERGEFRKSLVEAFKSFGVAPSISARIHAAFTARLLVVLSGPQARRTLEAYAHVVCGGRIFYYHASPSLLEPSELFGKVDVRRRCFVAHSTNLLDVLEAARRSSSFGLVAIEGANRGPTESYLLPLLDYIGSERKFQLFHPASVRADDPYQVDASVPWPENVLLALTVVEGATTLPITPELWTRAVLIDTDVPFVGKAKSSRQNLSEITHDSELMKVGEIGSAVVARVLDSLSGYEILRDPAERFLTALASSESDESKLRKALVDSLLLPMAVGIENQEEREDAISRAGEILSQQTSEETAEFQTFAAKIRRRIG